MSSPSIYTLAELSGLIISYHDLTRTGKKAEFPIRRGDRIIPDKNGLNDQQTVEQALDRYFEYVVGSDGTYIVTGVLTKLL